ASIILVNAGAGSGKTAVLTLRLLRLLKEGISPWNILALTFTRHAAGEMRRRIESEAGVQKKLTLSTFHAFAASLLERWGEKLGYRKNFSIYDAADQLEIVREILEEQGLPADPTKIAREMQLGRLAQNDLIVLEYQRRLKERNAVDYQGLLVSALSLLREHSEVQEACRRRFTHLLVDEVQDTDPLQWAMIEALHPLHLFMTGDDYQSIYQFRGAKIDHILSFPARFPEVEVIRLEQNYRSTLPVVEAANRLIAHNRHQLEKKLWTRSEGSVAVSVLEADTPEKEAESVAQTIRKGLMNEGAHPGETAILYRTHLQAIPLARALQMKKIPCQVITHSFWEKEEIRHFMALLTILHNPGDDTRLKRILPADSYSPEILSGLNLEAAEAERPLFDILPDSFFKEHLLDLQEKLSRGDYPTVLELAKEIDRRFELSERYTRDGFPLKTAQLQRLFKLIGRWQEEYPEDHSLPAFLKWQGTRSIQDELREDEDSVKLLTVHAAKGLEWPTVFVCGLEQGLFPMRPMMTSPVDLEEERRLMYVAITRAKEALYLSWAKERNRFGRTVRNRPSQFLTEMVLSGKAGLLKTS
ncbi:MAG TPA: UvrD-helicase domain-containing protein, partial [Candidatus Manganitrophaceae bacterium]|nr:UvrD-helicase domain-containing protein [Candidatus Manganitrophaceae bacterium]